MRVGDVIMTSEIRTRASERANVEMTEYMNVRTIAERMNEPASAAGTASFAIISTRSLATCSSSSFGCFGGLQTKAVAGGAANK